MGVGNPACHLMLNKLYTQKGCQPFHDTEPAVGEYYLIDALKKNDKVVFLGSTGHAIAEIIDAVSAGRHAPANSRCCSKLVTSLNI